MKKAIEEVSKLVKTTCGCGLPAVIVKDGRGYCNDHAWIVDETKPQVGQLG